MHTEGSLNICLGCALAGAPIDEQVNVEAAFDGPGSAIFTVFSVQ